MQYSFNLYNKLAPTGLTVALNRFLDDETPPVILCIGSDMVTGDSLGPVTGTLIKTKTQDLPLYVYGTLSTPVTAKEIKYVDSYVRKLHPNKKIIAIDAAVGEAGEVGLIRVQNTPLFPGSGAKKSLGKVGDLSILGIVAEKKLFDFSVLSSIRFNLVYRMADIISSAVCDSVLNKYSLKKSS